MKKTPHKHNALNVSPAPSSLISPQYAIIGFCVFGFSGFCHVSLVIRLLCFSLIHWWSFSPFWLFFLFIIKPCTCILLLDIVFFFLWFIHFIDLVSKIHFHMIHLFPNVITQRLFTPCWFYLRVKFSHVFSRRLWPDIARWWFFLQLFQLFHTRLFCSRRVLLGSSKAGYTLYTKPIKYNIKRSPWCMSNVRFFFIWKRISFVWTM